MLNLNLKKRFPLTFILQKKNVTMVQFEVLNSNLKTVSLSLIVHEQNATRKASFDVIVAKVSPQLSTVKSKDNICLCMSLEALLSK